MSERGQIVAFLRGKSFLHSGLAARHREDDMERALTHNGISHTYSMAAEAVARGDHLTPAQRLEAREEVAA